MTEHEQLQGLASDYAFGTLQPEGRRQFAAHLDTCAECQREVRELLAVGEALGRGLDPVEPPPALRTRVLTAVAGEPQESRLTGQRPAARSTALRSHGPAGWLALAASLTAAVLGLYAWVLHGRLGAAQEELRATRAQLATSQQLAAGLRQVSDRSLQAAAILTAPDVEVVELAGQTAAPAAHGRAFWSPSRGLVVTAANLPALPEGRVYQLWVVTADRPVSAGLLTPDEVGNLAWMTAAPGDLPATAIALTLEPEGGVPAPTGAMYLVGAV